MYYFLVFEPACKWKSRGSETNWKIVTKHVETPKLTDLINTTIVLNWCACLQGRLEDLPVNMTLPNSKLDLSGTDQNGSDMNASRISMMSSRSNMTSTSSLSSRGSVGLNREAVKLYSDDNVFKYIQITEETTALELVYIGLDQVRLSVRVDLYWSRSGEIICY